jgi:hypothetical protein
MPMRILHTEGAIRLIINDIVEVLYAPAKAFKRIIENPKYLGAVIVLLLFVGVALAYESAEISKVYSENTFPSVDKLPMLTNATLTSGNNLAWQGSQGVNFTNNFVDYFNYNIYVFQPGLSPNDTKSYYNLYGNNSLQIDAANTQNISAALGNVFNVNCDSNGFHNISMTIKLVAPNSTVPTKATLTLYSINDVDFYTYDLTPSLSNVALVGSWDNLTIPVGPSAQGWTSNGSPTWGNITSLKIDLTYPSNSDITIRIGALFFRGQYLPSLGLDIIERLLLSFALQFAFTLFVLSAIMFLFFKGLKTDITWKPIIVAVGFALFVMVIRELVNLVAALAMPTLYLPVDITPGTIANPLGVLFYPTEAISHLMVSAQVAANAVNAATSNLGIVALVTFVISYVWLGALCSIIVGTLKPEFSMLKRIAISASSVAITVVILYFVLSISI